MPGPLGDIDDIRRYSNALRLMSERRIEGLTRDLTDGKMTVAQWQEAMKAELRRGNHEQFVVGKGGVRSQINRREYLQLGPELKRQYRYLDRFAAQIQARAEAGKPITFAMERAKLYARSTQASMWRSAVPVKLPQAPRDGKTRCRTNCKCRLQFDYERGDAGQVIAVLVYWKLRPAEHCDDCIRLSREWNPKRFAVLEESASVAQSVGLLLMEADDLSHDEAQVIREMWDIQERVAWALH
ncbi:MAG: hypothetical protein WCZ87_00285 [Thiohalobacteraceae bacterium]